MVDKKKIGNAGRNPVLFVWIGYSFYGEVPSNGKKAIN